MRRSWRSGERLRIARRYRAAKPMTRASAVSSWPIDASASSSCAPSAAADYEVQIVARIDRPAPIRRGACRRAQASSQVSYMPVRNAAAVRARCRFRRHRRRSAASFQHRRIRIDEQDDPRAARLQSRNTGATRRHLFGTEFNPSSEVNASGASDQRSARRAHFRAISSRRSSG